MWCVMIPPKELKGGTALKGQVIPKPTKEEAEELCYELRIETQRAMYVQELPEWLIDRIY